jgi:hypothetical protein
MNPYRTLSLPQNPLFIVGYPRSGTTLLQGLLSTQPGIYSFPETHYFDVIHKELKLDWRGRIRTDCLASVFSLIRDKTSLQVEPAWEEWVRDLSQKRRLTAKSMFECIVLGFLLERNPADKLESAYCWVEKTPVHFRHIDRIKDFYPASRILFILRHPVPAVFSRIRKFPFNRDFSPALLAERWNRMIQNLETAQTRYDHDIFAIRYEDLTADPHLVIQDLVKSLGGIFASERIADFGWISRDFVLESEPWKQQNLAATIRNTNDEYRETIDGSDIAQVEELTFQNMQKYGYTSFLPDTTGGRP